MALAAAVMAAVNSQGFSSFALPFRPAVTSARRFLFYPIRPPPVWLLRSAFAVFPLFSSCAAFCRVFSVRSANPPFSPYALLAGRLRAFTPGHCPRPFLYFLLFPRNMQILLFGFIRIYPALSNVFLRVLLRLALSPFNPFLFPSFKESPL